MYAISASGYRSISAGMELQPGETKVSEIPVSLLKTVTTEKAKADRSLMLRSTDWTQMDDSPLSAPQKLIWATYRQSLRDLPSLPNFPDVPWPSPPSLDGAADGTIKAPI